MKTLTTFLGILINIVVFSKCSNIGISVFPNKTEINKNSIFLIEGFASSQKIINSLNKEYRIYLQNGNQKITLNIVKINVGDFQLTQAILKPEYPLEIGKEYIFKIDNLPKYEVVNKFNNYNFQSKPIIYKVISNVDIEKPLIEKMPYEINKSYIEYGCGPESNVIFSFIASDSSEIIIKTTVKNLATKKITTFYLIPDNNKLRVGYDMCSGAFKYDSNMVYEVDFDFVDSSGNVTKWNNKKIKFTKPTKENNHAE